MSNPLSSTSSQNETCCVCFDEFHKSFGNYTNTIRFHITSAEATSHRIHFDCAITWFKTCLENSTELCCPLCRDPVTMKYIVDIAKYTLETCRACKSTPGATSRECPYLLPGFVADIDMEFALRIIAEKSKAGDAGKRPLASAIVTYWNAAHSAF